MKLKNLRVALAVTMIGVFGSENALCAEPPTARPAVTIDTSRLSTDLVNLGKLLQSGVDEKVVVSFIQNSPPKRNPTAEELIHLHELGLSSEAMVALMNAVPKVSLTETQPIAAASSEPQYIQRTYQSQPGGTMQSVSGASVSATAPTVTQAPAQTAPVSGNTVISSPTVVYTQPAPATVYVQQPPVVTYVEPVRPRVTFSFGFGHFFGHHGGHYWGRHHGGHWRGHGHHGGHWGGHRGRH